MPKMKDPEPIDVFLFRRDLRTADNVGFSRALASSTRRILPVFVFSPSQADPAKNAYYSAAAFAFMLESLDDLDAELGRKLCRMTVQEEDSDPDGLLALTRAIQDDKKTLACVHFNEDVTPFARARDARVRASCAAAGVACRGYAPDYTLFEPGTLATKAGGKFKVYTPFYEAALRRLGEVKLAELPRGWRRRLVSSTRVSFKEHEPPPVSGKDLVGGRRAGSAVLRAIRDGAWKGYDATRDRPTEQTTRASAYLKFGCISCREFLRAVLDAHGPRHALVREILWREFYFHLAYNFPHVLRGQVERPNETSLPNASFKEKYDALPWRRDPHLLDAWQRGRTGVPLVDAGMRQLNETGYMHNRLRMVTAMFLTKDLGLDWREGERYFATKLIDYDPCQNNGGWQWSASTGADAAPYFRVFNPWLQSAKHDPDAAYIKRYVPELAGVPADHVHAWHKHHRLHPDVAYPPPIVDHDLALPKIKSMFANLR
jgi:deoxyribodipyrimidine photo-lyase